MNGILDSIVKTVRGIVKLTDGGGSGTKLTITQSDGKGKAEVIASIQVSELLGDIIQPWNGFAVTAAPLNSTFRIHGFDSVDKTTTITASEAGDLHAAAELIRDDLNGDATFKALYEAFVPEGCPKVFVHALEDRAGDCNERVTFSVTVAGGAARTLLYADGLKQRPIPIAIYYDKNDPTRGRLNIVGDVNTANKTIDKFDTFYLKNGAAVDMRVDGSSTPVTFQKTAPTDNDLIIKTVKLVAEDGNIVFNKFLDSQPLTNGVTFEIKSKGVVTTFPAFKTTEDIVLFFSSGVPAIYNNKNAEFVFKEPFVLKRGSSDYVKFIINDKLDVGVVSLKSAYVGYLD